jgi:cysteine desulfurase
MRIGNTIYLDHQASTPVDHRVFDAMVPYFGAAFANPHSADHAFGWASAKAVDNAAGQIGALIGADADEVIFTSGATEANNLAIGGLAQRGTSSRRSTVLVAAADHKSSIAAARAVTHFGLGYKLLPVDAQGVLDLAAARSEFTDDALLLSIALVNSEIGTVQPIARIAEEAHAAGLLVHCDAAQGPCGVDMGGLLEHADFVSLSGHKMYGPKGIGALCARRGVKGSLQPIIHGGGQQQNLRSGTVPTPLCVGMAEASRLVMGKHGADERERVQGLRDDFVRELQSLPWKVMLNGPTSAQRHPGNANVQFLGFSGHDLLGALQPGLAAAMGSACSSGLTEPSHVLRAIGLTAEQADASVRFSLGRHTTVDDVRDAVSAISEALRRLDSEGLAIAG